MTIGILFVPACTITCDGAISSFRAQTFVEILSADSPGYVYLYNFFLDNFFGSVCFIMESPTMKTHGFTTTLGFGSISRLHFILLDSLGL